MKQGEEVRQVKEMRGVKEVKEVKTPSPALPLVKGGGRCVVVGPQLFRF
jgi:hypothetical protein